MINSQKLIGAANQHLVLVTAGRLYVKVEDRYYEIDFRNQKVRETTVNIEENNQEINLSIYVTNEQLEQILEEKFEEYNTNADLTEIQNNITNIFNNLNDLEDKLNELEWNSKAEQEVPRQIQEAPNLDQISFEYIYNFNDGYESIPDIHFDDKNLVCPSCYVKHPYFWQRYSGEFNTDLKSCARWHITSLKVNTDLEDIIVIDTNKYTGLEEGKYYLYIVVHEDLNNDHTGVYEGYYLLTQIQREYRTIGGWVNLLAGIINITEEEEIQYLSQNISGVPSASKIHSSEIDIDFSTNTINLGGQLIFQNGNLELKNGIINMKFSTGEVFFGTKFYFDGTNVFIEDYVKKEDFNTLKTNFDTLKSNYDTLITNIKNSNDFDALKAKYTA